MELDRRIKELITPTVEALGFAIVRVSFSGGRRPCLQIMAERAETGKITVAECATISRAVSAVLDVEDPVAGAYNLEVSSPGIDRPLTRLEDFERYAGFEAKVEINPPQDGRKRFRGRIMGINKGMISIAGEKDIFELPFQDIQSAKLLLTDDLIAASEEQRKQ